MPGRSRDLDDAALAAAGVPTLASTLAALPADAFLDVELKGDDHGAPTAGVLRAARGDAPAHAIVSSFDEAASLATMRELLPDWPRWLNADDLAPATLSLALGLGCVAVSVRGRRSRPRRCGARARRASRSPRGRCDRDRRPSSAWRLGVVAVLCRGRRARWPSRPAHAGRRPAGASTLVLEAGDVRATILPRKADGSARSWSAVASCS